MSCLYLYDCSTSKLRLAQSFPLVVGNSAECGCTIDMELGTMGAFVLRDGVCSLYPRGTCRINGEDRTKHVLQPNTCYMISYGGGIFVVLYSPSGPAPMLQQVFASCRGDSWQLYDAATRAWMGPYPLANISGMEDKVTGGIWVVMTGMSSCMCRGDELMAMARRLYPVSLAAPSPAAGPAAVGFAAAGLAAAGPAAAAASSPAGASQAGYAAAAPAEAAAPVSSSASFDDEEEDRPDIDEEVGDYTCPVCWLHFNAGDVMSIATHPDLMGDPVLGRDSMRRFFATRFNARGQALDAKGVPCLDMACPHCRRKLPPNFLQMDDFIFSVIGAPSSGKSYYLASLVNTLERMMPSEFDLSWRDADPTGNSMLNDVMFRLFNAASPEQAYLSKTDLEGALYEEFYRHGRMAKLPKPFIYNLSDMAGRKPAVSVVFYDNAGEHFEPGRNSEDSPGAQHVAVASGLFFLFDPTTSRPFRPLIHRDDDPQLDDSDGLKLDQQAVIMSETGVRIASILNLPVGKRISTPLAVMIGKCDLWEDSLEEPLEEVVEDGCLLLERVEANSARLRRMMMRVLPPLCSAAESISDTVRYFAVSPLGCPPVRFKDPATGSEKIGPDPQRIAPRHIAEPTLWILSRLVPELVPSR